MSCKMSGHYSQVVTLLLVLLLTDFSSAMSCDFSTKVMCTSPNGFVQEGQRICYRALVDSNYICQLDDPIGNGAEAIAERENLFKIASPNFLAGGNYQDNTLCEYHIPQCASGSLLYVSWDQFNLEGPCNLFGSFFFCADFVELIQSTIDTNQVEQDTCNVFCGQQPSLNSQVSSQAMKIRFRSNSQQINNGFLMDFLCSEIETEKRLERDNGEAFRFRRQVEGDELKEDMLFRGKRFVISSTFRTSENCVELGGLSPPPIPTEPIVIPQNGSEVSLPSGVCLTYRDRVLTVFQRDVPLRTFRNISRLFFWTPINGTRVFERSARVPADEIFGGGRLRIVGDCAYYVTYLSPPRFNPNSQEVAVIGFLLKATNPFFVDKDIIDDGSTNGTTPSTTSPPTATQPPTRPPTKKKGYNFMKGYRPVHPKPTTPPPPEVDPRINVQAVRLALRFENACNIFLRQASRTFLDILADEGLLGPP